MRWRVNGRIGSIRKKENTLVIYLSDHGDEMARGKFDIYEASTKVPFMMNWSGKVEAGVTSEASISSTDIVSTVLEAVGVPIPQKNYWQKFIPII